MDNSYNEEDLDLAIKYASEIRDNPKFDRSDLIEIIEETGFTSTEATEAVKLIPPKISITEKQKHYFKSTASDELIEQITYFEIFKNALTSLFLMVIMLYLLIVPSSTADTKALIKFLISS